MIYRSTSSIARRSQTRGFTLIELIISLSIFAFMTAFLVARYGTFNQGVLLTNLAYDTALTVRNAQAYGLDVQGQVSTTPGDIAFTYAYGVHFSTTTPTTFIFFVDLCGDGFYVPSTGTCHSTGNAPGNEMLSTYTMRTGFIISSLCAGAGALGCIPNNVSTLDILFKRPNPDALIVGNSIVNPGSPVTYAKVTMSANDASKKSVVIQSTGQIEVSN